jgi:regulatory factor X, other
MSAGPEAALLQYHASMLPPNTRDYQLQNHTGILHHDPTQTSFMANLGPPSPEPFPQQDHAYNTHAPAGSIPVQMVSDLPDEKKRKMSAVTATNDRELREMLAKNENRPLKDVAQEVIQKERTPMAERTKQLFAMLW